MGHILTYYNTYLKKSHNLAYNIQTKGRPNDQEEYQLMKDDNDNTNENQIAPDWGAISRQWEAPLFTAKGILNLEKPSYLNGTDYDKGPDNYWITRYLNSFWSSIFKGPRLDWC